MLKLKKFVITLIPQISYTGFSKFYFYKDGVQLPYTLVERLNNGLEARIKIGEATLYLNTDNIYSNRYFVDTIFGGTGSFYTQTGTQNTKITVTVEEGVLDFDYATFQMWTDGYAAYCVKMLTIDFYNQSDKLTDTFVPNHFFLSKRKNLSGRYSARPEIPVCFIFFHYYPITSLISYIPAGFPARYNAALTAPLAKTALE